MSRRALWWLLGMIAAAGLAAVLVFSLWLPAAESHPELCSSLSEQRIARVHVMGSAQVNCQRTPASPAPAALLDLLGKSDVAGTARALREPKSSALAVPTDATGSDLIAKLTRFATPPSLRALAVGPALAVYTAREETSLSTRDREALAYVARALLRGAREPSFSSFPPALRKVEHVEVMVLLRERGEPRLWRSAKGTSLARALLTAARVARERWRERENAMGGALAKRLLDLDVEVTLLSEDGTLLSNDKPFVERVVSKDHGIGFEYMSGWHYVLPEDMQKRGKGSAYRALESLAADQGLPAGVLKQSALRVYRLIASQLGVSKAPL